MKVIVAFALGIVVGLGVAAVLHGLFDGIGSQRVLKVFLSRQ